MATPQFDICVIGGGAAGLVVAAGGSTLGAKVALVEKHEGGMGGDCLHYGCVPSKTLLRSAKRRKVPPGNSTSPTPASSIQSVSPGNTSPFVVAWAVLAVAYMAARAVISSFKGK